MRVGGDNQTFKITVNLFLKTDNWVLHHSNVSHWQHEGERQVDEKAVEENTDVGKSEECDGGHQVNLIIKENKIT